MNALEHHGIEDNTLFILTSDNGCSPEAQYDEEELFESVGIRLINFPMQSVQKQAEKKPAEEKPPEEESPDSAAPGDWRRYYVEATADS